MLCPVSTVLFAATLVSGNVIRRDDPPLQSIPTTGQADNTFNNGAPEYVGTGTDTSDIPPDVYGARSIDLPFNRLFNGSLMFFPTGQLNTPDQNEDRWINNGGIDSADQSACGIPDNAFLDSKVAIHPYFLKYADLSRYCMQDVCISFWSEDWKTDMMLKVTDICSTDPNDPTHCASPGDIKITRTKAKIWSHADQALQGDSFPAPAVWFFMKCWADGLVQPAYNQNWFAQPALPNDLKWAQGDATDQYNNNQVAYAAKGWPTYSNGAYNPAATTDPIDDWVPGSEPTYAPVAGGKGWGNNAGPAAAAPANPTSAPILVSSGALPSTTPASGAGSLEAAASSVTSIGSSSVTSSAVSAITQTPSVEVPSVGNVGEKQAAQPVGSTSPLVSGDIEDDSDECEADL